MKNEQTQRHSPTKPGTKNYQEGGKWIEKPNKTLILICACGNKYLKTRPGQMTCISCIAMSRSV